MDHDPARMGEYTSAMRWMPVALGAIALAYRLRGFFGHEKGLNVTDEWTPGPETKPDTPVLTSLVPYTRELIASYLEPGERIVGFARAFFVPHRMKDVRFGSALAKLPLIVAATPERVLLFEATLLTVHGRLFVPNERITSMRPPKAGPFGTSGQMRFGLADGREYQFGFHGPLLNAEGMRQEQQLAEHFRRLASRIASSSHPATTYSRAA